MVTPQLSPNLKYEPGMIVEDGDIVRIHGCYENSGPKLMVAVDISRVKDGELVEHWDVLQDEVPIVGGNPMFTKP